MERKIYFIMTALLIITTVTSRIYNDFPDYGNDNKVRVWESVMSDTILDRLYNFLNNNNITNCYEFEEEQHHLLLKCWSNEYVVDVSVMTRNKLVLMPKFDEANTLGINKKITKGFVIPPVKYINEPN